MTLLEEHYVALNDIVRRIFEDANKDIYIRREDLIEWEKSRYRQAHEEARDIIRQRDAVQKQMVALENSKLVEIVL